VEIIFNLIELFIVLNFQMCVKQKCMAVKDFRAKNNNCGNDCNGNGVCNSKGNCHCKTGYAPPYCDYPGPGGSVDSGPASSPNSTYLMFIILLYSFILFTCFLILAFKGFMTGMYVLTFGAIPLLLAVLLFAYCSKNHRSPSDWNKANRKKLSYVSKCLPFIERLQHLVIDDGDGNSNACTTTTTRPLPIINTVSSLVTQYNNEIYLEPSKTISFYNNTSKPILENAYINSSCSVPPPNYIDAVKSRLSKSDIIIANLMSTTNPQVNSYLQDGVWGNSK